MALFYNFVLRDMLLWLAALAGAENLALPALQLDVLTTILYALLGLGGLRTFEKIQGRTK